jgi:hypothetical protein
LHNARSPRLDLEYLYGDGPTGHLFLYQRDDPAKFLLGLDGGDLQRNAEGIALIGDPRNDSHLLMSQLHLALLKAHNALVDEAPYSGATCLKKRPGSYAGTIDGSLFTSFYRAHRTDAQRSGASRRPPWFQPGLADLYRPSLRTLPIGMATLRFATATS